MSVIPNRSHFEAAYAGQAPWDISGPQPALVDVAADVTGSILDAGCGTGENSLFFAARGHKVTGIDYLEEPIRRAKQKAAERNMKASFLVVDALQLADLPEVFDSVIDCGLFHCFDDDARRRYVAGLATVMKPGGRLWLLCFSDQEPAGPGPRRVTQQELHAAFAEGFAIESIEPTHFDVRTDIKDLNFSPGGPKAWLAVIARR